MKNLSADAFSEEASSRKGARGPKVELFYLPVAPEVEGWTRRGVKVGVLGLWLGGQEAQGTLCRGRWSPSPPCLNHPVVLLLRSGPFEATPVQATPSLRAGSPEANRGTLPFPRQAQVTAEYLLRGTLEFDFSAIAS